MLSSCISEICGSPKERAARGIGGALYEAIREILERKGARAILLDVPVTDSDRIEQPDRLPVNQKRLRFYEQYGASIIRGTHWDKQATVIYRLFVEALGSS